MADTTLPGVLLEGDHASRPAANTVASGTLYACSTHSLIYQSDASSWSTWATLGETGTAAHIADATDAHDASAVSADTTGYGNSSGDDVQEVLDDFDAAITAVGGGSGYIGYIHLQDQKSSGTASGGFTSGAWRTRTLNTEVADTNNDCSLASNQFTLSAGTYEIEARAGAVFVSGHQIRLRNTTDNTTVLVGSSAYAALVSASDGSQTDSVIQDRFTIGASKALEIQHQCAVTRATNGFGVQAGFGEIEVYCDVVLRRVS